MGNSSTVLVGCEVICIGEQATDLIACPLTMEDQLVCEKRRQYQAGRTEVVEWVEQHRTTGGMTGHFTACCFIITDDDLQAFKELKGIK